MEQGTELIHPVDHVMKLAKGTASHYSCLNKWACFRLSLLGAGVRGDIVVHIFSIFIFAWQQEPQRKICGERESFTFEPGNVSSPKGVTLIWIKNSPG